MTCPRYLFPPVYSKCFQVIESHSDCSLLQDSLDKAIQWSEEWDLAFNTSKTNLVQFSRKSSHCAFAYSIGGCDIPAQDSIRDLGFFLLSDLFWSIHYSTLLPRPIRFSVC